MASSDKSGFMTEDVLLKVVSPLNEEQLIAHFERTLTISSTHILDDIKLWLEGLERRMARPPVANQPTEFQYKSKYLQHLNRWYAQFNSDEYDDEDDDEDTA